MGKVRKDMYKLLAEVDGEYLMVSTSESPEWLMDYVKAIKRDDFVFLDATSGRMPQYGLISIEKALKLLKVKKDRLKSLISQKKITALAVDGTFLIDKLSIIKYKKKK